MKKMSRRAQAELLRKARIFNDHGITQKGHPFFSFDANDRLTMKPSRWSLCVKGRKFKGPWYQNGSLWFCCNGVEERKQKKQEALKWIEEHFPGVEMAPSPFFRLSFVPKQDLEEALKFAQEGGVVADE